MEKHNLISNARGMQSSGARVDEEEEARAMNLPTIYTCNPCPSEVSSRFERTLISLGPQARKVSTAVAQILHILPTQRLYHGIFEAVSVQLSQSIINSSLSGRYSARLPENESLEVSRRLVFW